MLPSTLSMNSRLHLMFVLVIIGITVYLYFVYREIRNYDMTLRALKSEIVVLKKQLNTVEQQVKLPASLPAAPTSLAVPAPICSMPFPMKKEMYAATDPVDADADAEGNADLVEEDGDNYLEDDMSVTSNEIHDIITNIVHVSADDGSGGEEGDAQGERPRASSRQPKDHSIMPDLTQYPMEDLCKLKYDDLRNFLRSKGVVMKGTKQELSAKIKELGTSHPSHTSDPSVEEKEEIEMDGGMMI